MTNVVAKLLEEVTNANYVLLKYYSDEERTNNQQDPEVPDVLDYIYDHQDEYDAKEHTPSDTVIDYEKMAKIAKSNSATFFAMAKDDSCIYPIAEKEVSVSTFNIEEDGSIVFTEIGKAHKYFCNSKFPLKLEVYFNDNVEIGEDVNVIYNEGFKTRLTGLFQNKDIIIDPPKKMAEHQKGWYKICCDCGKIYQADPKWYAEQGLAVPKRCKECRQKRNAYFSSIVEKTRNT